MDPVGYPMRPEYDHSTVRSTFGPCLRTPGTTPGTRRATPRRRRDTCPRGLPPPRARGDRLDRRLLGLAGRPAGARPGRARRRTTRAPGGAARAGRGLRGPPRRPRRGGRAGADALAAPALLRLLPGQLLTGRDPRRPALQRHRRAGDDLGHQPGGHRGRAGRRRLAGPGPRPARAVPARRPRPGRRRHPGHRLDRHVHRAGRRPALGQRRPGPRRRAGRHPVDASTARRRPTRRWSRPR